MNVPAFVLAGVSPSRAVLTARPWLCGSRIATISAARLATRPRLNTRIFACEAPPTGGQEASVPAEDPAPVAASDASVVASDASAVASDASAVASDASVVASDASVVAADASVEDEAPAVAEEPVAEEAAAQADDEADDSPDPAGEEQKLKRRRRRGRKREITLPLEDIVVGQELEGVVKSVTDYGAFVGDMGTPTDGLLHVSQLKVGFVEKVTDVVNVGDKIKVRVLGVDMDKGNFSLTMKTQEEIDSRKGSSSDSRKTRREGQKEKWDSFSFDPKEFVDAKVTSVTDFGAFCQLIDENGGLLQSAPTEGLIHISALSDSHVSNVGDILSVDQVIKVRVIGTDRKRNRISMSLKAYSEGANEEGRTDIAAGIAQAESSQPKFKTAFELAFERAKAVPKQ